MARGGKWFSSFFSGKKERNREEDDDKSYVQKQQQQQQQQSRSPVPSPGAKEKKRWSFRRPGDATRMKDLHSATDDDQKRHDLAVAAATKAAAEAAAAAAQAAAVVIRLTASAKCRLTIVEEVAAATKIQAVFRSYLARKALRALKGIVKLQALIRGQLVRKLVLLHAVDRAHRRTLIAKEARMMMMMKMISRRQFGHRGGSPSPLDPRCGRTPDIDRNQLENIKISQMDLYGSKWNSRDDRKSTKSSPYHQYDIRKQQQQELSSPTSALTDKSEESSFRTSESSPYPFNNSIKENMYLISNRYDLYPNYMANTASSMAKARSQSTPRQRPASPRRRTSIGSSNEASYQFPRKENFYSYLV